MASERPVIGLICCQRSLGGFNVQAVLERYISAVVRFAEVDALLIPSILNLQDVRSVLRRLDGVLLTGSPSNVDPRRYGEDSSDAEQLDLGRDESAFALIEELRNSAKPLFGICRGFQEINAALGGRLRRDVANSDRRVIHHVLDDLPFDAMFEHRHNVVFTPGGVLANSFGVAEMEVNSVHYQAIAQLAPGLAVEAEAPDGIIEAVCGIDTRGPLLAVQWHPEHDPENNPQSAKYFRMLGACARGASLKQAAKDGDCGTPLR